MNNSSVQLSEQLKKIAGFIKRHSIVLAVLFFAGISAYILIITASLLAAQPSSEQLEEQANAAARPQVSDEIVRTIEGLEDRNVQVQAIFNQARENPFTE